MASISWLETLSWNSNATSSRTTSINVIDDCTLIIAITGIYADVGIVKTVSGVTCGGVAMDLAHEITGGSEVSIASIWTLPVTTGTYTIVVTFSASVTFTSGCGVAAMLRNHLSDTPSDVDEFTDEGGGISTMNNTIEYFPNGAALYLTGTDDHSAGESHDYDSATSIADRRLTYGMIAIAQSSNVAADAAHIETVTGWSSANKAHMISASWETDFTAYTLDADPASYTLTDGAATFATQTDYTLVAEAASYILSLASVVVPTRLRDWTRHFNPYGPAREADDPPVKLRAKREWLRKI